jgi:hypothetical protein
MILANYGIVSSSGASFDTDALSFITAASISDLTQKTAINTLVTDLKTANIWTKMKALYPFVGGTASSHKWNLKDPRDLNAAYRLVFNGGWTHSSTGALPNGTTGYAETYLAPLGSLTTSNYHLSHYSRTQITSTNSHDMGCEQGAPYGYNFDLYQYFNSVSAKGFLDGSYPSDASQSNNTNTLGLLIGNRTASTIQKTFFNGALLNQNTNLKILPLPSTNVFIGATNTDQIASSFSTKQCGFASIGDGLTDTEAANLYSAVQTYQTTLSRNV